MFRKILTVLAAVVLALGLMAASASTADAAKVWKKTGSATVKEGRKVVRQADKQRCLTRTEVRKIIKGAGYAGDGSAGPGEATTLWWYGKAKAQYLVVEFGDHRCAQGAVLYYDNGNAYAWLNGSLVSAP